MDNVTRLLMQSSGGKKDSTYIDDVFSTYLYKGSASATSINNGIDLAGEGGMTWIKDRSNAYNHVLQDTVRGAGATTKLASNLQSGQGSGDNALQWAGYISAFNNNGFSLDKTGSGSIDWANVNKSNDDYTSWTFRKKEGFFDIVTWTGNGSTRTIAHNLGSLPGCIMVKNTSSSIDWTVWHRGAAEINVTNTLKLNTQDAAATNSTYFDNGSTPPTKDNFTVHTSNRVNAVGETYVAYVFAGGESTAATARSVDFDGNDSLTSANNSDYSFGSGDFTVEGWIKLDMISFQRVIGVWGTGNTRSWGLQIESSTGNLEFYVSVDNGVTGTLVAVGGKLNVGQWYHFAAVRNGNTYKLFVNGTEVGSSTLSGTLYNNTSDGLTIGKYSDTTFGTTYDLRGSLSNIRVVKGTAVYTSSFRPPYKPLTNITNTKLLCCNNSSTTGSTVAPSSANTYSINVTASGSSAYTLSGNDRNGSVSGSDPTVTANVGDTLNFAVNASGHPFYIRVSNGGYNVSTPAATNQGTQSGTVSWTPNTAGTYYYQCGNHSGMIGTITINAASGSITASGDPTASTDSPFDDPEGFKFGEGGDQNIIKTGSYVGNGTVDGPEIYLGWEPQWFIIKRTDASDKWPIYDSMRGIVTDGGDSRLYADETNTEYTVGEYFNLTPTGIKITKVSGEVNGGNGTYVYIAIRRPDGYVGKPAEAGTDAFFQNYIANADDPSLRTSTFAGDFALWKTTAIANEWGAGSRLTQKRRLVTDTNAAETANSNWQWGFNDGFFTYNNAGLQQMGWMWKRGAGFDVVTYAGVSATRTIRHGMGKVPEMIWFKSRTSSDNWQVYHKGLNGGTNPASYTVRLNASVAESNIGATGMYSDLTSNSITLHSNGGVNFNSKNFIAMLFASVDGISSVGSYSPTSTSTTVTCGFQPRFVVVKAATKDNIWSVADSIRGITAGNDPALALNENWENDKYGGADWIDVSATGFTVNSTGSGTADANSNGETYIYYAHA